MIKKLAQWAAEALNEATSNYGKDCGCMLSCQEPQKWTAEEVLKAAGIVEET